MDGIAQFDQFDKIVDLISAFLAGLAVRGVVLHVKIVVVVFVRISFVSVSLRSLLSLQVL